MSGYDGCVKTCEQFCGDETTDWYPGATVLLAPANPRVLVRYRTSATGTAGTYEGNRFVTGSSKFAGVAFKQNGHTSLPAKVALK